MIIFSFPTLANFPFSDACRNYILNKSSDFKFVTELSLSFLTHPLLFLNEWKSFGLFYQSYTKILLVLVQPESLAYSTHTHKHTCVYIYFWSRCRSMCSFEFRLLATSPHSPPPYRCVVSYFLFQCLLQVNPHTNQLKLCDFGSAKMLVCYISTEFELSPTIKLSLRFLFCSRYLVNQIYRTFAHGIIGLLNWSLELQNTRLQLTCGRLVVLWLSYSWGR